MAETKRMHYVPRTYLKYFSKERGGEFYIHAMAKDGVSKPFETNINNICVEKDFYTLPGEAEKDRQLIENMYNELYENNYDQIYKILTDDTRVSVTHEERYSIIGFVVSMFFRNNSWSTGYYNLMDESYAKAYDLSKVNNKDSFFFGDQEVSISGKTLEELQKDIRSKDRPMIALTAAKKIFQLIRTRAINDVVTVVKSTGIFEYITSDNPVTFRSGDVKQIPIPMDPNNTLSIPIDKNHLLQLRPWGHELDRTMIGRMTEQSIVSIINVAMYNQFQFGQSGRFILGTESSIKNFKHDPEGNNLKKDLREL